MIELLQVCYGGLVVGSIYAMIALGFCLVYRVAGVINLAQGGFCILAVLVCITANQSYGWPLWIAVPVALLATMLGGAMLGWVTFVPALGKLSNANVLMLTVGLLTMLEGFALVVWGSQPYALAPFSSDRPVRLGPILAATQSFWVFGATLVSMGALWLLLARTRMGRALRACAQNPMAARLMGINVPRMMLASFALAALMAAVAGLVVAPTTSLQFDTGRLFTNFGFIAAVIGGISSFPGAIAGGLLLGLATQLATAYVSSLFANAIALVLLLIILVARPDGLMRSSAARRQDVREEARVAAHIVRLDGRLGGVLAVVGLGVALALPLLVTNDGIMSSVTIAAILFIALIGLDVLMGYAGQVSLGQAGFMAIGGYTSGYLAITYDTPPLIGIVAGIALSLLAALLLSVVTLRLKGLYLALATLAFGLLVEACAVGLIDLTGGPSGLVGVPSFSLLGYDFGSPRRMYYLVLAINVALLFALAGAMRSGFGRALKAIRTDQMAAAALGINIVRTKLAAFLLSAALASLSGSLYAFYFNFLSPEMVGVSRSLELVSMLVIGGEGTLIGALFGSLIITLLPTVFQPLAVYKTFFSGALLTACCLHLPQGVAGLAASALAWRPRRRAAIPSTSPRGRAAA